MNRLLLLPLVFLAPHAALADCAPGNPGNGEAVLCSGTDTDGFSDGSDALTITVDGIVSNAAGDALRVRGTGNTIVNNRRITGGSAVVLADGIDGGDNLTVTNNVGGLISGSNRGIDADERDNLTVVNASVIYGNDRGIRNGDGLNANITNSGVIEGETDEGIETGSDGVILNTTTGVIRASDDAVNAAENVLIDNYGLIESLTRGVADAGNPQDAIDIDSGTINNYTTGIIRSDDDAAIDFDASDFDSVITNEGVISGTIGVLVDPLNIRGQTIENFGLIEGTGGLALSLGGGSDSLTLHEGGRLAGAADFGADDDGLGFVGNFMADIAGGETLFGGTGTDTVVFFAVSLDDIVASVFEGALVRLSFLNAGSDFSVALDSWDVFTFGRTAFSRAELQAALAPVPLPASVLLMLPALGGLVLMRRRKRG